MAAVGGVGGGLSEFEELEVPAPWPVLPAGRVVVVALVLEPAWCPGRAFAT